MIDEDGLDEFISHDAEEKRQLLMNVGDVAGEDTSVIERNNDGNSNNEDDNGEAELLSDFALYGS